MVGDISDKSVDEYKEKMDDLTEVEKKKTYSVGESMAEAPMEEFLGRHVRDPTTARSRRTFANRC